MKLKSDYKVLFLFVGFIGAWFALATILNDHVQNIGRIILGPSYYPEAQEAISFQGWLVLVVISSLCLAIGLKAEESISDKPKQQQKKEMKGTQ